MWVYWSFCEGITRDVRKDKKNNWESVSIFTAGSRFVACSPCSTSTLPYW